MRLTARSLHKCLLLALAPLAALAEPNPLARSAGVNLAGLDGRWNGANLEQRSNCSAPQNNGSRGTYAEYVIGGDPVGRSMGIEETAITGLRCTYSGYYQESASGPQWSGNLSCSDGKSGTFQSKSFLITPNEMSIRLGIKLSGTEICDVDAILGGSRF